MLYASPERLPRNNQNNCLIRRIHANNDGSEISLCLTWTNYMLIETRWIFSDFCTTYGTRWQLQTLFDTNRETLKLVLHFPLSDKFYLDTRFNLFFYEEESTPLYLNYIHHTDAIRDFLTIADLPLAPILPLITNRNSTTTLTFKFRFTHLFKYSASSVAPRPTLSLFLNHKSTSDCCIEVEQENIYVHKLWLSEQSPFFKAMFESNFMESTESYIPFKDWKLHSFICCLIHMYSGWLPCEIISEKILKSFPMLEASHFPPQDMSSWMDIGSLARMLGLNRFAYYAFQNAHDMLTEELFLTKHELMNDNLPFHNKAD
ncbi:hypothetical protein HMI55_001723 [Coelomomyces lativittatus]|nr:hypothetical protein HMI56_001832 [Coelomomyces lativittatus]KAJ1505149.1 hypothetical protein HMI55_001723 [Coelomomyces lativittatus]